MICLHATFYNFDALDLMDDQQELTGSIVEEVWSLKKERKKINILSFWYLIFCFSYINIFDLKKKIFIKLNYLLYKWYLKLINLYFSMLYILESNSN